MPERKPVEIIERDTLEGVEGPAVVIQRHQRATDLNETSYGMPRATRITGINESGEVIDERGLLERNSRFGQIQQNLTERWKVRRVRTALSISAIMTTLQELFDEEMESRP